MNIREINFGVVRLLSCDPLVVVHKTIRNFQLLEMIPILFPQAKSTDDEFPVCIKSSELTAIIENLFQNVKRATNNQSRPQIRLSFRQTDQYLFLGSKLGHAAGSSRYPESGKNRYHSAD